MLIYIGILVFKIIEDALATLRIIVVANDKKLLGAFLQFVTALVWVIVTGTVIIDIQKDPLKILFFALGSLLGSYLGSILEEKLALGNNTLMVEVDKESFSNIVLKLKKRKIAFSVLESDDNCKKVMMITLARKMSNDIIKVIKSCDNKAFIVSEKVKIISRHV